MNEDAEPRRAREFLDGRPERPNDAQIDALTAALFESFRDAMDGGAKGASELEEMEDEDRATLRRIAESLIRRARPLVLDFSEATVSVGRLEIDCPGPSVDSTRIKLDGIPQEDVVRVAIEIKADDRRPSVVLELWPWRERSSS